MLVAVYVAWLGVDQASVEGSFRVAEALADRGELLHTPAGIGFPLLISSIVSLGGYELTEVTLAVLAAGGFVLGALLARRIVPEPYASAGAALAGLSAPAVAYAGVVGPEMTAGVLLAGATLLTVSAREDTRPASVFGAAAMLAVLPWLDPRYLLPALPIAFALYEWCRRGRRPTMGLIAVELVAASVVTYVTVNERVFGGPTPWSTYPSGVSATGAFSVVDHVERVPRLVTLWLDPGAGLLRWAPVFALVFFAAWLLRRSRIEGLARVVPERATAEAAAGLALAVIACVLLVAAFLTPTIDTQPFAARNLVPALPVAVAPIAWGLRHAPRVGAALGAVTLVISGWVLVSA